jgi:hypothetical protein
MEQDNPAARRERPRRKGLARRLVSPKSYGIVLLLILACYGLSVSLSGPRGASVVLVVQVATVWFVLRASGARRSVRRAADVMLVVTVGIAVGAAILTDDEHVPEYVLLASTVLYLIAPLSIMRDAMSRKEVDAETFLGAISAYLLIGLFFALAYQTIGAFQSAPFFGQGVGDGQAVQTLFFSFTTLTTTGYGNLVPAGNPGQSMAVMEMLVGQIFLATAIAKVITSWTPRRRAEAATKAAGEVSEEPFD